MNEERIDRITEAVRSVLEAEGTGSCCQATEDPDPAATEEDTCCPDRAGPRVVCICL